MTVKNLTWTLSIQSPGVSENEDGVWVEDNGVYALKEDRYDHEQIVLTLVGNDMITFITNEDGYLMNITLKKVA